MDSSAPTALIVEDDDAIREILETVAHYAGFETATARHGLEALRYLDTAEQLPSVVLLDLMMPIMDGWQFLERRNDRMRAVPVVVLTARPTPTLPPELRVLHKPVALETILEALTPYVR
jgi:CheY-like chemotaxis protein